MSWKLLERPFVTSRRWVMTLTERPPEITTGRWRAMQLQLEQDRACANEQPLDDDFLVFWIHDIAQ